MVDPLRLLTGIDIPLIEIGVTIHQPTIREISLIGEEQFFIGCEFINFSKEQLVSEDKKSLEQFSDFDILLTMINSPDKEVHKNKEAVILLLSILFPHYQIGFSKDSIVLIDSNENKRQINNTNFNVFKENVLEMFCIKDHSKTQNPGGDLAKKIADKMKRAKEKKNQLSPKKDYEESMFGKYISILAVGERKDMNLLCNQTVYQLFDEYQRFSLKEESDITIKARLAGAKDVKTAENWMKDLHLGKE